MCVYPIYQEIVTVCWTSKSFFNNSSVSNRPICFIWTILNSADGHSLSQYTSQIWNTFQKQTHCTISMISLCTQSIDLFQTAVSETAAIRLACAMYRFNGYYTDKLWQNVYAIVYHLERQNVGQISAKKATWLVGFVRFFKQLLLIIWCRSYKQIWRSGTPTNVTLTPLW